MQNLNNRTGERVNEHRKQSVGVVLAVQMLDDLQSHHELLATDEIMKHYDAIVTIL